MPDKRKHFLQLSIVFGAITILALLNAWGFTAGKEPGMAMMGQSMGQMMRSHHAENITFWDLFGSGEAMQMGMDMSSHHSGGSHMQSIHRLTTIVIVILLPFVVAGAVFLGVTWIMLKR
ncbi:MAG: hypothetical protein ACM3PP_08205 [Candidatus Saccharibacteria bacterium]